MININVYVANNCPACKRAVAILQSFSYYNSRIKIGVINIESSKTPISIVPAVYLNDELYCFGEIDKSKLRKKVNNLLN
ncbi:MAG: hypothetical protein GY936_08600 [Ignavibacteriae bacterium]|nr:hypothetical protein [Ignavibacteriota bacterium]